MRATPPTGGAPAPSDAATRAARAILAAGSKSFALAGRLLPAGQRDRAAVVYAYCRRADDAVDQAGPVDRAGAVARLRGELARLYAGEASGNVVLDGFAEVARACRIPERYPAELLAGMEMDATGQRYDTVEQLLHYGYRVAGTVGLMMCHVLGLRDQRALVPAVHLGLAMQLTNICRDVEEDWRLGRLYLPAELLDPAGARNLASELGSVRLPARALGPASIAVEQLLALADRYYRSADLGMAALPWRASLAIRTARLVYAAIGDRIAARGFDVGAGRAVVPGATKLVLVGRAAAAAVRELPARAAWPAGARIPDRHVHFGPDVLCLP
ncbi:MAG TPA: phytoene/squalene synthase family protein [Kofleriaceae bacterium]|nr:phytoene/squalene synthase family protein [Kofleriaceae bacterium]